MPPKKGSFVLDEHGNLRKLSPKELARQQAKKKDAAAESGQDPDGPLPKRSELPSFEEAAATARRRATEEGAGKEPTKEQMAHEEAMKSADKAIPPTIRSVLQFSAQTTMLAARLSKASPGVAGGVMFKGKPYCYAVGYRDASRGMDAEDKGNFLRLRDPIGVHTLSMPVTALAVWQLQQQGKFDMAAPVEHYIKAGLPQSLEGLHARDILGYTAGLRDADVYRTLGIALPGALSLWGRRCQSYGPRVFAPLEQKLCGIAVENDMTAFGVRAADAFAADIAHGGAGGAASTATQGELGIQSKPAGPGCGVSGSLVKTQSTGFVNRGPLMRAALVSHLANPSTVLMSTRRLQAPAPSHFAFALLAAAVESAMKKPFEDVVQEEVFEKLDVKSAGFGAPRQVHRSTVFYEPTVIPAGHWSDRVAVPPMTTGPPAKGTKASDGAGLAAPAVFNGSLNAFAQPEDFSKVLVTACQAAVEATKKFPPPSGDKLRLPYCELGLHYDPRKEHMWLWSDITGRRSDQAPFMPCSGSVFYNIEKDVGAFGVLHCGNRRSRAIANLSTGVLSKFFIEQCLDSEGRLTNEDGSVHSSEKSGPEAKAAVEEEFVNLATDPEKQREGEARASTSSGKLFSRQAFSGVMKGRGDRHTKY